MHKCQTLFISTFPEFWPDLKEFQLVKKVGIVETWMYKVGSRHLGESSSGMTFELHVDGERVTPLRFEAFETGSASSKFSFREIRKTRNFYPLKPSPAYFQIPAFCFPTNSG